MYTAAQITRQRQLAEHCTRAAAMSKTSPSERERLTNTAAYYTSQADKMVAMNEGIRNEVPA